MITSVDEPKALSVLALAEAAAPALSAHGSKKVLTGIERLYPEMLHAVEWFLASGHVDEARRLVIALGPFWKATGLMEKSFAWFDRVLAPAVGSDELLGETLYEAAGVAFEARDDARASSHYRHANAVAGQVGDAGLGARSLVGLARIALRSKDVEGARRFCRQALAEAATGRDATAGAGAYRVLAAAAQVEGDLDEARQQMMLRVELGRRAGDMAIVSDGLRDVSELERQRGNLDRAEAAALEALEADERRGNEWSVLFGINAAAAFFVDRGLRERAAMLVGAAETLVEAQGEPWPPDELAQFERTVRILESSMDARAMEFARATGRDMSRREAVELCLGRPISAAATSV